MFTATRALRAAAERGEPLPSLPELAQLERFGFQPRRGQFTMVAGQSGAAKTFFALWLVLSWNLRTVYFAQDSDEHTMICRTLAWVTGYTTDEVAKMLEADPGAMAHHLEGCQVRFVFGDQTVEDMELEIEAGVEVWDEYPEVIIVDNFTNVDAGDDSYGAQQFIARSLHRMTRTGAAVIALHHTRSNPYGSKSWDTNRPQPRWEIQGKLDRLPAYILTVAVDRDSDQYLLSPVKNRTGPASEDGSLVFRLGMDLSRANFYTLR